MRGSRMKGKHEGSHMKIERTVRRAGLALAGVLVIATTWAAPLAAQASDLEGVEELVRMGRAEEARASLLQWFDASGDEASRRDMQRALWLRGRLTVDPVQAELDFQRLIVLYPRGPFTPDAILRMAQGAFEMGDAEAARAHVATLARDYASSPVRQRAEAWLRTAGDAPAAPDQVPARDAQTTTRPTTTGGATTTRPPAQPPANRPANTGGAPTQPASLPTVGAYFVQLGAFAEVERAVSLYEEVAAQGVEVRIVRVEGSRFLHVRFGRFVERADAVQELERLAEMGITAALVRDERAESLVRE